MLNKAAAGAGAGAATANASAFAVYAVTTGGIVFIGEKLQVIVIVINVEWFQASKSNFFSFYPCRMVCRFTINFFLFYVFSS